MNTRIPVRRWTGLIGVAAGTLAIGLMSGGIATATTSARGGGAKPTRIRMEATKKDLYFSGPATIKQGSELQIVNKTNPKKVGPHTFSVFKRKFVPTSNKQFKQCEKGKGACGQVAVAHEYDPATNKVNRPNVEVGKTGWDKGFTDKSFGDSWYTEGKNTRRTRTVSAAPGTKLFYICAIHPFMQGKITVVK